MTLKPRDLPKVFLSYAEKDHADALNFKNLLLEKHKAKFEQEASKDWIFLARQNIPLGEQWYQVISNQLFDRRVFLLLVSPRSLGSDWCLRREAYVAWKRQHVLIPIIMDGRAPIQWLRPKTWQTDQDAWKEFSIRATNDKRFSKTCSDQFQVHCDPTDSIPLGEFQAAPKNNHNGPVSPSITKDTRLPEAASDVLAAIIERAQKDAAPILEAAKRESSTVFLCDQDTFDPKLRSAKSLADGRPLILLLQGQDPDCLGEFWQARAPHHFSQMGSDSAFHTVPLAVDLEDERHLAAQIKAIFGSRNADGSAQSLTSIPTVYRWEIGRSDGVVRTKPLMEALPILKSELAKAHPCREVHTPDGSRHPSAIVVIMLYSNMEDDNLRKVLEEPADGVHAVALPRVNSKMTHEHVRKWAENMAADISNPAQTEFNERASALVQQLKKFGAHMHFELLRDRCREYALIHEN